MPLIGAHGAWQGRERLDEAAHRAVERAEAEGGARGLKRASPDLLLLALLREEQGIPRRALAALGVDVDALLDTLGPARAPDTGGSAPRVALDADAREAVILGVNEARRAGVDQADTGHLLLGLVETRSDSGVRALIKAGATIGPLRAAVDALEEAAGEGNGAAVTLFAAVFRPFLARIGGAATCPRCAAPLHRSFRYCYNCGSEHKSS